jgi:hypothetical protein
MAPSHRGRPSATPCCRSSPENPPRALTSAWQSMQEIRLRLVQRSSPFHVERTRSYGGCLVGSGSSVDTQRSAKSSRRRVWRGYTH